MTERKVEIVGGDVTLTETEGEGATATATTRSMLLDQYERHARDAAFAAPLDARDKQRVADAIQARPKGAL